MRPDAEDAVLAAIVQRALPGCRLLEVRALGVDGPDAGQRLTAKAAGYGVPLRLTVDQAGAVQQLVLHGTSKNAFGHDRRADRAAELLLAADSFDAIPRHVRVLDVGAFTEQGSVSLAHSGEFYLLTEYAKGTPYAEDLRRIAKSGEATAEDARRAGVLARYLVELHAERRDDGTASERALRDLLGSGEGIFGICDAYARAPGYVDVRSRLHRIERLCLDRRWSSRERAGRCARIHGDFHPFNILFDDASELRLLDTSRGSEGDPADDVSCLAINYVFFALERPASWKTALRELWLGFWRDYLAEAGDDELLERVGPFLAWRLLVLACPAWYPNLEPQKRGRLLELAEIAVTADRFEVATAERVFA